MEIDGEQLGEDAQCGDAVAVGDGEMLRDAALGNFLEEFDARLADRPEVCVRIAGQIVVRRQAFHRGRDHFPASAALRHMEHGFDAGRENIPHKWSARIAVRGLGKAGITTDNDIFRALRGVVRSGMTGRKSIAITINVERFQEIDALSGEEMQDVGS